MTVTNSAKGPKIGKQNRVATLHKSAEELEERCDVIPGRRGFQFGFKMSVISSRTELVLLLMFDLPQF